MLAANLPLVPSGSAGRAVLDSPKSDRFGYDPYQLRRIRRERLNALGLDTHASYASLERIVEELEYARRIIKKVGCMIFDVSNKAVEEVANKILQVIRGG